MTGTTVYILESVCRFEMCFYVQNTLLSKSGAFVHVDV